jgi:hypothetical protein
VKKLLRGWGDLVEKPRRVRIFLEDRDFNKQTPRKMGM